MDANYRYSLERGSKKHYCPDCKKKTFVRFVDTRSDCYLKSEYGRCDRENNCGYWKFPPRDKNEKIESIIRQDSNRLVFEFEYSESLKESVKALLGARWDKDTKHWYIKHQPINDGIKEFADAHGFRIIERKPEHKPVPIPVEVLNQTLQGYEKNTFIQNLLNNIPYPFEASEIERIIELYYLGTVCQGYRKGGITFPFIDQANQVWAIQVKTFNKDNKTLKTSFFHRMLETSYKQENKPLPGWLQGYLKNEPFVSCLFGAHLLKSFKTNPVALVEAPKSAIVGTLYFGFPDNPSNLLWLAVYNLSSLKLYKIHALAGRTIYLFPDLSKTGHAFSEWSNKAKEFKQVMPGTRFIVSDLLEQLAPRTDKNEGQDLADYLIKLDWRKFRKQEPEQELVKTSTCEKCEKCESPKETFFYEGKTSRNLTKLNIPILNIPILVKTRTKAKSWDKEIIELEAFFSGARLPKEPIALDQCSTINDVKLFVRSHLATVKSYNGNRNFEPYLERLKTLKQKLQ